jgi:hypothetical protein
LSLSDQDTEWNPENFLFSPRNKSKILNWSESEAELYARDESDRWLSMKGNKKERKNKRKKGQSPLTANHFKKQDKKLTPY